MKINKKKCAELIELIEKSVKDDNENIRDDIFIFVDRNKKLLSDYYLTAKKCAESLNAGGYIKEIDENYIKTARNAPDIEYKRVKKPMVYIEKLRSGGFPTQKIFWDIYKKMDQPLFNEKISNKWIFEQLKK